MSRLEIWAAVPTPFDGDGRVDLSVIPKQAAHLRASGVYGAFATGTTGEFGAMTSEERRRVVETWAEVRPDGLRFAAHVGGTDLVQATELAAHAEAHGVDFIAAVAPYYGEAPTVQLLCDHLRAIASAAPATSFCYYHIPGMTGSTYRPSGVVSAASAIPTLNGVKFTDEDLLEYERTAAARPGIRMYFGRDELLPAALSFGADAVIGSLFNGLAPLAHRVCDAYDRGEHELALRLHRPFRVAAEVSNRHGGPGFVKELMNRLGPDAGPPRMPWGPLAARDIAAVEQLVPSLQRALADATAETTPA